jgi:adenylosuccinate lyase
MNLDTLKAISPIDGRYHDKTKNFNEIFSEYGLIKYRVLVEVRWLQFLNQTTGISEVNFGDDANGILEAIVTDFDLNFCCQG